MKKIMQIKRFFILIMTTGLLFSLPSCTDRSGVSDSTDSSDSADVSGSSESMEARLKLTIGKQTFTADLEDNDAVTKFTDMLKQQPITLQMTDYSGFEKVGALDVSLPSDNSQITTSAGDIVLYNENQIVIFYGSNTWSYTKLGHIDDLTGWEEALGSGDVTVTFSLE